MKTIKIVLTGWFIGSSVLISSASDIYVDVYGTPAADTKTWNSVSFGSTGESGFLVDMDGTLTSVKLDITSPGLASSVATEPFTGEAAEFEPARSPDGKQYYQGGGVNMTADVTGLNPSSSYTFTFVGQRIFTSSSGLTRYTATGANSGYADLNPHYNTSSVARVTGIIPTSSGTVNLSITGGGPHYILAFKIQQVSRFGNFYIDALSSASADPNGYFWNALPFTVYRDPRVLTNSLGITSEYTVKITSTLLLSAIATIPLEGDAAEFEPARTSPSYPTGQAYGHSGRPKGSVVISNLVADQVYNFTFTGSRGYLAGTPLSNNYKTLYRATGFNSASNTLIAHYNTNGVAHVDNIFPASDGTISLDVTAAADNNSDNLFYIIGFKMEALSATSFPVIVEPYVGGTVTSTTHTPDGNGLYWVESGQSITLEATAESGWTCVGWGGDVDDNTTANSLTVSPQVPMTLRAGFARNTTESPTTIYMDTYGRAETSDTAWNTVDFGGVNTLSGLIAADGRFTPVKVTVTEPFLVAALGGGAATATLTGDAAEFNVARLGSATNKQYYGGTALGVPGVGNLTKVAARVTGLTPGNAYTFTLVGSQNYNSTVSCTTLYRVIGANTRSATLATRLNLTNVATVPDVVADADGGITLEISDEGDTTGEPFYLLAFKIEGVVEHLAPNILWYGNSFTSLGDIPGKVADLAELAGYQRHYCFSQIGSGMPVAWHTNRLATVPWQSVDHITGTGKWDYVVIQGYPLEASTAITNSSSAYLFYPYIPPPEEGFIPDSLALVDRVRESAAGSGAKTILYETWPLNENYADFYPDRIDSPAVMEEETRANYKAVQTALQQEYGFNAAGIAYVGEAFAELDFDADLYASDKLHAGPLGQDLSAMVLFSEIYDLDMKDSGVTWAAATTAGWTIASEAEWNELVAAADHVRAPKGTLIIIR